LVPLSNGLYRDIPLDPENKVILNQLGQLMMFCLNARQNYPIGMIFDHGFFALLTKLQPHHFDRSLDSLFEDEAMFEELVDMYISMEGANEKEQDNMQRIHKFSQPFSEKTEIKVLKDLYYSASCEYNPDGGLDAIADEVRRDPAILKQHLPALQAVAREFIRSTFLDKLKTALPAVIEIAKGMKASPFTQEQDVGFSVIQKMTPSELSEKIQGTLTKELVLKKLKFDDAIPSDKQSWLEEWLNNADLDKIKKFVFSMSGAYAIGTSELKIYNTDSGNVNFHTCFNCVDLPFKVTETKEMFNDILEASLIGKEKYSQG
jgi:hypothetical protein